MERLAELISKLKEQHEQNADTSKLLGITLLIERELMKAESPQAPVASSSKVSVMMPAARNTANIRSSTIVTDNPPAASSSQITSSSPVQREADEELRRQREDNQKKQREEEISNLREEEFRKLREEEFRKLRDEEARKLRQEEIRKQKEQEIRNQREEEARKQPLQEFDFNPHTEIPTLAQQHTSREINEMLGGRDSSLNDKLKEYKVEIGHVLTDHPIRDLKKAIGINDRYVFINELFRGDEVMYERSLKTINGFRIFAEAEYWIERELKVKLGWEEHKETTRHFYQLIKRRFA